MKLSLGTLKNLNLEKLLKRIQAKIYPKALEQNRPKTINMLAQRPIKEISDFLVNSICPNIFNEPLRIKDVMEIANPDEFWKIILPVENFEEAEDIDSISFVYGLNLWDFLYLTIFGLSFEVVDKDNFMQSKISNTLNLPFFEPIQDEKLTFEAIHSFAEMYLIRSNYKRISPYFYDFCYKELIDYAYTDEEADPEYGYMMAMTVLLMLYLYRIIAIGNQINLKFLSKWKRIWNILVDDYNPLDTYTREIIREYSGNADVKFGSTVNITRDNTNKTQYDSSNIATTNINESTQVEESSTDANSVYGFNSYEAVDSDETKSTRLSSTTRNFDDNKELTENTHSGTDTITETISGADSKTGTDTTTKKDEEIVKTTGRNMEASKIFETELEFRKNIFWDIVFKDIDSVLTLPLY